MGLAITRRSEGLGGIGDGGSAFVGRGIEDDTEMRAFPFGWDLDAGSGTQTV